MSKTQTENQTDKVLLPFAFPLFGFHCEAESLEEAQKLLQKFINNQSK